jgi:hypothetical protein
MEQLYPEIDLAVDVRPDRIAAAQPWPAAPAHLRIAVH